MTSPDCQQAIDNEAVKDTRLWCRLLLLPPTLALLFLASVQAYNQAFAPLVAKSVLAPLVPMEGERYSNHSQSTCFQGDSDCPPCPPGRDVSVTSFLHLSPVPEMRKHVFQAQQVIRQAAPSESSIVRLENLQKLHTSLNYWCCHTRHEEAQIVDIVKNLEWDPIPLRISETGCNLDHDNQTVYVLSLYDEESQARLLELVQRIESAMQVAGIPVINPRHQAFHSTLARVQAGEFPVDRVVAQIHETVPEFAAFEMNAMQVGGQIIHANGKGT